MSPGRGIGKLGLGRGLGLYDPRGPAVGAPPATYAQWHKPESLAALGLVDSDPVTTWPNSALLGSYLSGTGGQRPLYKTGGQNGSAFVRFDGVDDNLIVASGTDWDTGIGRNAFTLFAVFKINRPGGAGVQFFFDGGGTAGNTDRRFINMYSAGIQGGLDGAAGVVLNNSYTDGNVALYTLVSKNGSSSRSRINAGSEVTGTISATTAAWQSNMRFGASIAGASFYSGDLYEIMIFPGTLSAGDFAQTEAYLMAKYALP